MGARPPALWLLCAVRCAAPVYERATCDGGADVESIDRPENGWRCSSSTWAALPFGLRARVHCAANSFGLAVVVDARACGVRLVGIDSGR